MKNLKNGWIILVLLALASCSSDELGPERDVSYFMEHVDELDSVIAKCANDPGRYQFHPNCVNAFKAQKRRMLTD